MAVYKFKTAAGALCFSILLAACGELDMVLPSSSSYEVDAFIDGYTLEECSIISSDSRVRPYFVRSIEKDPDVTGLLIFLQTLSGEPAGQKARYVFVTAAGGETAPEKSFRSEETGEEGEETAPPNPPEAVSERVIIVQRSKNELPPFPISHALKPDQYNLVFQVLRQEEVLYKTQKPVYFLGDAQFALEDIRSYRPDETGSYLIPAASTVMLEALITADEGLTPYIIWYRGKKTIGEGYFDGNVHRFLWKTPDQSGFLLIRAEVFPSKPRTTPRINGKSKEFSLPITSKKEGPEPTDGITHWYQFQGDLGDARNSGQTLEEANPPQWLPCAGIYGLAVGPQDAFTLREAFAGTGEGQEELMIRFAPRAEGTVFSLSRQVIPSGVFELELSVTENSLILSTGVGNKTPQELVSPDLFTRNELITAHITFQYNGDFVTVEPRFEGAGTVLQPEYFTFNATSGEGVLRLGGHPVQGAQNAFENGDAPLSEEHRVTAIVDELTITHTGNHAW